jgi:hypothetical protein
MSAVQAASSWMSSGNRFEKVVYQMLSVARGDDARAWQD